MSIAVLPFSSAEGVQPALGRQLANFVAEALKSLGVETNSISFLAQLNDQPGKVAFVNIGDALIEPEQVRGLFDQAQIDHLLDGKLKRHDEGYELTARIHHRTNLDEPLLQERSFKREELFDTMRWLLGWVAEQAGVELPEEFQGESMQFGTQDPDAFFKAIEGYDALSYIQQSQGNVAREFDPIPPIQLQLEAIEADKGFELPYVTVIEICRLCAQHRIGRFLDLKNALVKLTQLDPEDYRAWYALAEMHMAINEPGEAANYYEKALSMEPEESALYTRLGIAQMAAGMPVNAERNFRKAIELEGDDKPSADYLAAVLTQTGRAHEVPAIWKERIEASPQDAGAHARYAMALQAAGREDDAVKALDHALETLEEPLAVKRVYAPILANRGDVDRAMDFYEDWLDETPTDVPLLLEYAQTLNKAGRDFEIPEVLRNVIQANPDPNTRAQTMAWLIELEQPKRAEVVESAGQKAEAGDFEGAIKELRPLRTWLADYWKMWGLLAACHNRLEQWEEAEEAASKAVNLFPAYEPAYAELTRALTAQGKNNEAYNAMRFAAMNIPNSLPVALNLGLAAKRAGHSDEARQLAKQIREAVGNNQELEPALAEMES